MVDIIAHQKPLLLGVMALPTFHIMGLFMQLVIPLSTGRTIALYAPQAPRPPIIPNPANTLAALESTGSNFTCSVPTFIEVCRIELLLSTPSELYSLGLDMGS
jgi:acyl-coenzyme A synthetase/AMP-(fatty) acid ligase